MPIFEHKGIDYSLYSGSQNDYIVKVEDVEAMDNFLSEKIKVLIEISVLHHLESNGEAIMIFSNNFALAKVKDYSVC